MGMSILSIVVPAYNEESGIAAIIKRILEVKQKIIESTGQIGEVELIVVNDASSDRTAEIASQFRDVVVVSHERNKGYGGALKTGFERARGEYIGFLDADGTYPPEHFPDLCQAMFQENADMVVGSRMSGERSEMPFQRYIGNKLFAYLLSWIVGKRITDTASGMRVFKRGTLPKLFPLPDGLHLTPAMSTRALHEGLKIVEVPIPYEERVGRSKLNPISDGFRFLNIIIGVARLYNPLKFFGAVGVLLLGAGLFLSIDPILYYLRVRRVEDTEIYRLFTIMVLYVTGINLMSFGAFSNYVLDIMHGKELNRHGLIGRYFLSRRVIRRSGLLGTTLMALAVALNHQTILEYLTKGHIYVHWSYVLTGATFFLVGLQLLMGSILIRILEELRERQQLFPR